LIRAIGCEGRPIRAVSSFSTFDLASFVDFFDSSCGLLALPSSAKCRYVGVGIYKNGWGGSR
jgi:hypothetical protein